MFKTALVVEDHQTTNISVQATVKNLNIDSVSYAYYCDDALSQLKNKTFELLITDLSFAEDGHLQNITTGKALIEAARKLQPGLKVLVFSGEKDEEIVAGLYNDLNIDGYVPKGRTDAQDLKEAIECIFNNKKYSPIGLRQAIRKKNAHDFTDYDITIISQLAKGTLQKEIPAYLQQQKVVPASLSSVEKRLNFIKEALGFSKNEQLVAYCKDKHII